MEKKIKFKLGDFIKLNLKENISHVRQLNHEDTYLVKNVSELCIREVINLRTNELIRNAWVFSRFYSTKDIEQHYEIF
jgi:hypothetical protein